ncbi:MAG: TRAP transporter small permease subunit [Pseudomonadales bacterium]|nr:TRAP transporter small permease subunit [Pseudomonadales bacterium]
MSEQEARESRLYSLDLPETAFSYHVDRLIRIVGDAVSWIWVLLLAIIVINVIMRYLFAEGRIEFEEIQWHLYSTGFLIGLSYGFVSDSHVRVDVLRERMRPETQAWIELYGLLFLLLPFIMLVILASIPFVSYSFATGEVSQAPGGLPFRWAIKGFLTVGFFLLLIVTLARLSRVMSFLFGWPGPRS